MKARVIVTSNPDPMKRFAAFRPRIGFTTESTSFDSRYFATLRGAMDWANRRSEPFGSISSHAERA
jgi:hypothetical protein